MKVSISCNVSLKVAFENELKAGQNKAMKLKMLALNMKYKWHRTERKKHLLGTTALHLLYSFMLILKK